MSVFAYGEAVRHLEQALRTQEVLDPDDKTKRCDLLLALGEAMLPMEEPRRVADTVAAEAFAIAETMEDSHRAARAAVQALEAFSRRQGGDTSIWRSGEFVEWAGRADRHAEDGTVERIYADIAQFLQRVLYSGGPAARHVWLRRAVARAQELGDNAAFFAAAAWALSNLAPLRDRELVGNLAEAVIARPYEGARSRDLAQCLYWAGVDLLRRGDRQGAERAWREEAQLAERTRDVTLSVRAMQSPAVLALIDGRLEEALALLEAHQARAQEVGVGLGAPTWHGRTLLLLGRASDLLGMLEDPARVIQAFRAVVLAHLGRAAEARKIREGFGDVGSDDDESSVSAVLLRLLESSSLAHDEDTTASLVRRLAPLATEIREGASVGRLLGDGAALLGRPDEARAYYEQALDVCSRVRFRPEIALIRLSLAELLLEHHPEQQAEAQDHLDFAIAEFREMKMQPALERALGHKGLLKA